MEDFLFFVIILIALIILSTLSGSNINAVFTDIVELKKEKKYSSLFHEVIEEIDKEPKTWNELRGNIKKLVDLREKLCIDKNYSEQLWLMDLINNKIITNQRKIIKECKRLENIKRDAYNF